MLSSKTWIIGNPNFQFSYNYHPGALKKLPLTGKYYTVQIYIFGNYQIGKGSSAYFVSNIKRI